MTPAPINQRAGMASDKEAGLTAAGLRELFDYDPYTGLFARKIATTNSVKAMVGVWYPGSLTTNGYMSIRVQGVPFQAHRLAWLWMMWKWPDGQIDHRNGLRADNRFENLRDVTRAENQLNLSPASESASGVRGAHWNERLGKYQAQPEIGGKRIYLGLFDTAEAAGAAYREARRQNGVTESRG